jgi:hypothetical protein
MARDERVRAGLGTQRFLSGEAEVLRPEVEGVAGPIAMEDEHRGK